MSNNEKEYYLIDKNYPSSIRSILTLEELTEFIEKNPSSIIKNYGKLTDKDNESWLNIFNKRILENNKYKILP